MSKKPLVALIIEMAVIINALPSANIYILSQIVVGWILDKKCLDKYMLADQSAHGATNQLVGPCQVKRQIIDILK